MKKSDVIINIFDNGNRWEWLYCTKDQDETKNGFQAGKIESVTSTDSFESKEKALADLENYIKKYHLKKPNRIFYKEN